MSSVSTRLRRRPRRATRTLGAAAVTLTLVAVLAACGSSDSKGSGDAAAKPAGNGITEVKVAQAIGAPFKATTISVPVQADIRAKLPKSILDSGQLTIGAGALAGGFPPLDFVGNDQKTFTGSEPDLGRLVAAVFGLKPVLQNATWDNLFVGIDSGRNDVGFSNITDTEQRKIRYDFASYRQDNLAFEVNKSSTWNFNNDYHSLGGTVVAVGSGKININFGPNPSIQYHISQDATGNAPTRSGGTYSGAGGSLQGLIAATTKKGNGLAQPLADAINYLIKNGPYAAWLKAYNLSNEAVTSSEVNPPGLPITNS